MLNNERKIIIVKNIIFKDLKEDKIVLNRDIHFKRPCLIICEKEDKRYMLPIGSSSRNKDYKKENIKLTNYDLINRSLKKESYLKLDRIIKTDIYYKEPLDELDEIKYYKCLLKFIKFYNNLNIKVEEYEEIKEEIEKQLYKIKVKEKLTI
ncbi:MAG: hypothetical protein J6K21_02345 [Bacilli bacterium]|nr:hypothetical protein [Bacilli bacterium]